MDKKLTKQQMSDIMTNMIIEDATPLEVSRMAEWQSHQIQADYLYRRNSIESLVKKYE